MSDNKINQDSEEPLRDKNPLNSSDKEETPKENSDDSSNEFSEDPPNEKSNDNLVDTNSGNKPEFTGEDEDNESFKDQHSVISGESTTDENSGNDTEFTDNDMDKNNQSTESETKSFEYKKPSSDSEIKDEKPDNEIKNEDQPDKENLIVNETEDNAVPPVTPAVKSKPKDSNYQISLINENLLKVKVTSIKGVKIFSSVKEENYKPGDETSSTETQSNEIYYNPKIDFSIQEYEVLISIEDDPEKASRNFEPEKTDNEVTSETNEVTGTSNYLINLINENLLKIKISTGKGVRIDSTARDKRNLAQTQSNKIFLKQKPGNEIQEIEITIEIDEELRDIKTVTDDDGKIKLIPNPDVVDLIQSPDYSSLLQDDQEIVTDGLYKNPFDALRELIRKNLTIGLVAAVILHFAAAGFAFYSLSKKSDDEQPEERSRLIVIQDLPDPKIKLEDVEDPNKPKIEEIPLLTEEEEKKMREPKRQITPRRVVKPPEVTRPKDEEVGLDSTMEARLERQLDSLRQLREAELADSLLGYFDSTRTDSALAVYEIPDSLKVDFNENDIGLAMYYPNNWKLTDQREINKSETEFKGVVLADTTGEPGTMSLFIFLDNENKDYNAEDFKTEFIMLDSNLTAFSKEPKTIAGFTDYRFYLFNDLGTEKLSIRASVRKQFFEQYKNEIEAVVRSIRIKKKEDLEPPPSIN